MTTFKNTCLRLWTAGRNFCREDDGPTSAEYAVMLAVIIVAAIVGLQTFGDGVRGLYVEISGALET